MTRRKSSDAIKTPVGDTNKGAVDTPQDIDGAEEFRPVRFSCSFCNKGQKEVRRLIAGPNKVYICDECVALCREIIDDEDPAKMVIHDARRRAQQNVERLKETQRTLSAAQTLLESASMSGGFVSDELRVQLEKQCIQAILRASAGFGLTLAPVEDPTPSTDETDSQNAVDTDATSDN